MRLSVDDAELDALAAEWERLAEEEGAATSVDELLDDVPGREAILASIRAIPGETEMLYAAVGGLVRFGPDGILRICSVVGRETFLLALKTVPDEQRAPVLDALPGRFGETLANDVARMPYPQHLGDGLRAIRRLRQCVHELRGNGEIVVAADADISQETDQSLAAPEALSPRLAQVDEIQRLYDFAMLVILRVLHRGQLCALYKAAGPETRERFNSIMPGRLAETVRRTAAALPDLSDESVGIALAAVGTIIDQLALRGEISDPLILAKEEPRSS